VIPLLLTLVLVALLWFVLRTAFASHPPTVRVVVDVLFLVLVVALVARWLGLL